MPNNVMSFSQNDYEIINRDVPYAGVFRLAKYTVRHRRFAGGWTPPFVREILERASAAALLPYDPVLDQVVLIEQFRAGALANPASPWLIEIVAGVYGEGEAPIDVAKREAQEEANCDLLAIYPICEYFVSPGGSNEYLSLYCGCVDASKMGGTFGLTDEHEDIRAFVVSLDDALKMVQDGRIKTSPAIISLLWLQLNREWLKQLWLKK